MKRTLFTLTFLFSAVAALALGPGTDLFVPAVAHATGASVAGVQALWRSDIWIFNPSTRDNAAVDVFLLVRDQANPSPASRVVTVQPGETRFLHDVVLETFGSNNVAGALRLTSNVPVVVSGVTYDANVTVANKGTGASGQSFAAIPADFAIGARGHTDLVGLDQDGAGVSGAWRSNLALVETTGNPVNLQIERIDGLGNALATLVSHLEGFEAKQINNILTAVAPGTGTNQRIRVRVTFGAGRVVVAGSRVNNASGDPSTIEMTGTYRSGRFQGLLLGADGFEVDGGLQLTLTGGALSSFKGVAGIPCGDTSITVELAADPLGSPVAFNTDGSFSTLVSIPYSDEGRVVFTTDWTLSGAPNPDGSWSGTLISNTHDSRGDYLPCNGLGVSRQWKAGWVGGS
ncbi:MAG TPA: hypothetical protein PLS53_02220 [Thermoanaerobaculaceae bacterium]|nr:hypothetical protein [Thermoanaerobaculaceae bacterium]HPS76952.1 hypothetical protein [Thermoanaerobaculaceae bacterium]